MSTISSVYYLVQLHITIPGNSGSFARVANLEIDESELRKKKSSRFNVIWSRFDCAIKGS